VGTAGIPATDEKVEVSKSDLRCRLSWLLAFAVVIRMGPMKKCRLQFSSSFEFSAIPGTLILRI
jgi:hypothetical protein